MILFGVFTGAVQNTLSSASLSDQPPPPPTTTTPRSITTDGVSVAAMMRNEVDGTNRQCRLMYVQSPGQQAAKENRCRAKAISDG